MTARLPWPEAQQERLRELWATGMSRQHIATEMGLSVSGVVAQAHRMDLPARLAPIAPQMARGRPVQAEKAKPMLTLTSIKPVPLSSARGCAWPTWDRKDAAYWDAIHHGTVLECGAARAEIADVYCAEHKRVARGNRTA